MNKRSALFTLWCIGLSPLLLPIFFIAIGISLNPFIMLALFISSFIALALISILTPSRQRNNLQIVKAGIGLLCLNTIFVSGILTNTFFKGFDGLPIIMLIPVLVVVTTVLFTSNLSGKY